MPSLAGPISFAATPVAWQYEVKAPTFMWAQALWNGIATTTRQHYDNHCRHYMLFCAIMNFTAWPVSILSMGSYIIARGFGSIAPLVQIKGATIEKHLSGLRSYHLDRNWDLSLFNHPHIGRLLRGIKSLFRSQKATRYPITKDILREITNCPVTTKQEANLRAFNLVAFAGFFRCGELTYEEKDKANIDFFRQSRVCRRDVRFSENFDSVTITLRSSKTDTEYNGVAVFIAATTEGDEILTCPVTALRMLFLIDPQPVAEPLFNYGGTAFTRKRVLHDLKMRLVANNRNPTGFSGHSWRKGAAQHASDNGVPHYEIQILGRWTSEAFKLYITISHAQRIAINKQFQTGRVSPAFDPAVPPPPLHHPSLGAGNTVLG